MPVVLVHPDHGVFVGHFMGIPFWSRCHSGGQFRVATFPDEEKARQFIADGRANGMFEDSLDFSQARFVAVEGADHASIDALVKVGLSDILGDLRLNEATALIDQEIYARQYFSADARTRAARVAKARRDEKHDVVSLALSAVDIDRKPVAGLTCVFTGDSRRHYVLGYQDCAAKDRDREPRLSNCVVLHSDSGKACDGSPASIYDPAPLAAIAAARVAAGEPVRTVILHSELGVYLGDDVILGIWSKGDHRYLTTATGFVDEAAARACIERVKTFPDIAAELAASTLVVIPAQTANVSVSEMQAAGLGEHMGALEANIVKYPWIEEIVREMKVARGVIGDRTPMVPGLDEPTDHDLAHAGAEFLYAAHQADEGVREEAMAGVNLLVSDYLRGDYPRFAEKLDEASPAAKIAALFAAGMPADHLEPLLHPLDAAPAPGM